MVIGETKKKKKSQMDFSCSQEYPFDFHYRRTFNGVGENNAVSETVEELCNKRKMQKESDDLKKKNNNKKKKQSGSRACSRGHWRISEDSQLMELVAVYGPQNWNHIAENMQGRTGKNTNIFSKSKNLSSAISGKCETYNVCVFLASFWVC